MFKARHPRNLPASYYKPIGQILVRWTYTELYMQSIAWHALKIRGGPKAARLLTWGLNAVDKVKLFAILAPRWIQDAGHQATLRDLSAEAERLRSARNKLAHGAWGYKPGNRKEMRLYYLRNPDDTVLGETPDDVRKHVTQPDA